MAEFNKKAIPELPDIENYLDSADQFIVFDNRESTSDSKARKVTYEKIKNGIIADIPETEAEIKGIDYHIEEDEDNPLNSVLRIIYNDFTSVASTDKAGLMSTEDKTNLNNLEDGFNSKVLLGRDQSNWSDLININKIQGANGVWTDIEDIEGEKVLKISVPPNQYHALEIKNGNNYVPIDKLDLGQELFTEKIENNNTEEYKLKIDVEKLKRQGIGGNITAQVNGEEININKIISGENVSFQTDIDNPSNLIISSTGSSVDPIPTPEPTPSTKTFLAYTCLTENTSINKVIETEDVLEEGEVFTVYFENGFSNDNRIQAFTLTIGQQNKPIIFNESDRFSAYIINRFATFVKKEEGYFLISADADLGKGIRTSAPNSNGTESLYLYDNTPYTFINDLSGIEINNNQLVELFEEGKIKSELLPDNSGSSSSETIDNIIFAKETGRSGNSITVRTNGNYNLNQEKIIGIYFINSVNKLSNLKIDENQYYPIAYYEYQEDNFNNDIVLPAQSIGFFIFNNNGDSSNFELLATNSLKDDIPIISNSNSNNNVTNISQGNNQYSLINNNILENNHIKDNLLSSNIITSNQLNYQLNDYYTKTQIDGIIPTFPTIQGTSPIRINNDFQNDTINIGLNLPSSEDASNLYLNGTGQWTTVNNLNSNLFNYIIDMFIPVGSYYETSDADFHPGQEEQGRRSGGWISETEKMAYDSIEWKLVKTYTLTNDDNSTTTVYKWHKQGIIGAG